MSKELADSIVLAAQKMERNEVEVISLISFIEGTAMDPYRIDFSEKGSEKRRFSSFVFAYNYLAVLGYHKVSQDEDTYFKKSFEVATGTWPVIMVMSKKVNEE